MEVLKLHILENTMVYAHIVEFDGCFFGPFTTEEEAKCWAEDEKNTGPYLYKIHLLVKGISMAG